MPLPKIAISACLLGHNVRYNGGNKLDRNILEQLDGKVEWVPVCPETGCGMGCPREPIVLQGDPENPSARGLETGTDFTEQLTAWCARRALELARTGVKGFILKARSPSCGVEHTVIEPEEGKGGGTGAGIFTRILKDRFRFRPFIDEEGMEDEEKRKEYLGQIFG